MAQMSTSQSSVCAGQLADPFVDADGELSMVLLLDDGRIFRQSEPVAVGSIDVKIRACFAADVNARHHLLSPRRRSGDFLSQS